MQRLQQWMTENDRTQGWVAEQCGVKQPTVSNWLQGKMNPSIDNLKKLSSITGITIDDLLDNVAGHTATEVVAVA